jgi:ribosomal protein S12 methylthiotransferase accessory factor
MPEWEISFFALANWFASRVKLHDFDNRTNHIMNYNIELSDAFKQFTLDQDKVFPPEETVRRVVEKLKETNLDILDKVVRIDNGRLDIPVYFSICGQDALSAIGTQKQMGKGATPAQARASAVMELVERFSFFSFVKDHSHFIRSTYRELSGPKMSFNQIAQSVHDDSDDLAVSREFFEALPLNWTWAYNITTGEALQVPFEWFFTINEFNGPSAGNCKEEAILQGICEIVERHVCSLVSRNRLMVPGINPTSATDPMVLEMLQKYRKAGIQLHTSDFSLDMGIPTVAVLACDPSTFPEKSEIVWTAGTTPCPEKAMSRTLTEVAQLAGDFNTGSNYIASGLPKFNSLSDARYVMSPETHHNMKDLPDVSNKNIRCEVENCIQALARKNMDIFLIDTMHPVLEIPAFYTIIPGAHFRERSVGTSVAMFCAKIIAENQPPWIAIRTLKQMEKKLPGKYFIQFFLGSCHQALGNPEIAIKFFSRALDRHPTHQDIPSICSYMAVCYRDMEKYREALAILRRGEAADNERTDIYNLMGFCHFKLKEHEQAIECFKKVLSLDPSSAIDYANIGSNYRELGETEKALQYYELALELDPSIEFARMNIEKLKST